MKEVSNSNTILMESCLAGYDDIVAKIVEKCEQLNININLNDKYSDIGALEKACIAGSLKCVQLLLKNQSDYSAFKAIKYACQQSNPAILKELLEYEKQNGRKNSDPNFWLIKGTENDKEIFRLLNKYGVSTKCFCFYHCHTFATKMF